MSDDFHAESSCTGMGCNGTGRVQLLNRTVQCDNCIAIRDRREKNEAFKKRLHPDPKKEEPPPLSRRSDKMQRPPKPGDDKA